MRVGVVTLDGSPIGVISLDDSVDALDSFVPNLSGYSPEGRAAEGSFGGAHHAPIARHHGEGRHEGQRAPPADDPYGPANSADVGSQRPGGYAPRGERYSPSQGSQVHQGSAEVDQAIVDASRAHRLDPNTMRSIASIESGMNPSSNANRATQYKGLYQVGHNEWDRFGGGGNIYSARDNAMATGRMFDANRGQFRARYGRDPTDTELYMMHQQGLGFYTRGAMTNISGNPYPGMHGPQTHESFEAGWGREVARRKAQFEGRERGLQPTAAAPQANGNAPL